MKIFKLLLLVAPIAIIAPLSTSCNFALKFDVEGLNPNGIFLTVEHKEINFKLKPINITDNITFNVSSSNNQVASVQSTALNEWKIVGKLSGKTELIIKCTCTIFDKSISATKTYSVSVSF